MENKTASGSAGEVQLMRLLRTIPVPDPGADFEERLMKKVLQSAYPEAQRKKRCDVFPERWGWHPLGAAALSVVLLVAISLWNRPQPHQVQQRAIAVVQPVQILLESPRDMPGATIRVTLPADVELDGYGDVRVLRWRADIFAGGNRLLLPVKIGGAGAAGEIQVEVEYRGARKLLRLPVTETVTRT